MWTTLRIIITFFLAVPIAYSIASAQLILEDGFETLICNNPSGPEVCNGIDDDCNGLIDHHDPSLILALCENQMGVCAGSTKSAQLCDSGVWQSCSAVDYAANFSAYEVEESLCDGFDNDCDGETDESCASLNDD